MIEVEMPNGTILEIDTDDENVAQSAAMKFIQNNDPTAFGFEPGSIPPAVEKYADPQIPTEKDRNISGRNSVRRQSPIGDSEPFDPIIEQVIAATTEYRDKALEEIDQNKVIDQVIESTTGESPNQPATPEQTYENMDRIKGALETFAAVGFGGALGSFGGAGGTVEGFLKEIVDGGFSTDSAKQKEAADRISALADERAAQFSRPFAPASELGQEYTMTLAEKFDQLPMVPQLAFEANSLKTFARTGFDIAPSKMREINDAMKEFAYQSNINSEIRNRALMEQMSNIGDFGKKAIESFRRNNPDAQIGGSVGAQALDETTQRLEQARSLPVPIKLSQGEAERDLRFERENAKISSVGQIIRDHINENNERITQNFDMFLEQTGAELHYNREVGKSIFDAIDNQAKIDRNRINATYEEAKAKGETLEKVEADYLANHLNTNRAERGDYDIMVKFQNQLDVLELIESGDFKKGDLKLKKISINQAEELRKFVYANMDETNRKEKRKAAMIRDVIDMMTEGKGGETYRLSRSLRKTYGDKYENVGLVKSLLGTKQGTVDRIIADEFVVDKAVFNPSTSYNSLYHLKKILQNSGDEGMQGWRELQGSVIRKLQDSVTKNASRNEKGDPIVSFAEFNNQVNALDRAEKLDLIFGKQGAHLIRTLKDVTSYVNTAPPGIVNNSNTATVLAEIMSSAASSGMMTSIPSFAIAPLKLVKGAIKDAKLKKEIQKSLNYYQDQWGEK